VGIRCWNRLLLMVAVCGALVGRAQAQERTSPDRAASPIGNLQAKDLETRRNAASSLRSSSRDVQRKALPVMIELLMKEKDGQVRLAILDAVTALGPDAVTAVPALVHTLRSDYGGQRQEETHQDYRSAMALAAIGKPAVEGLRGLLKEKKESVRTEVVMALGRIGPDASPAVPDLIPLLGDKSERIRRDASRALGQIGPSAITPLLGATADKVPIVRARAVESLGYMATPDGRVHEAVLKCAGDTSPDVRAAALESLARLRVPDGAVRPVLADSLHHEDERVRLAAVDSLVQRRELLRSLAPELESLLAAKNEGVARHAAFLLSRVGPDAVPRLIHSLRNHSTRIEAIAEALSLIGRPAVGALTEAVKAPDARVRRGAALALGRIRPVAPGTAQNLTAGLADPDRQVKAAFLTAIGFLGSRAIECTQAVRGLLNDPSAEIRSQAIEILSQSSPRDERLLADLTPLVNDADAGVQRRAIDALRILGPKGRKAFGAVVGKLNSGNPDVRLAAVEFVESHGLAATEAIPQLTSLLDDPSPKVRTIAARSLGGLGKPAQPAFPRLTPLLAAEQTEVREAAISALASLELDVDVVRPHIAKALRDDSTEVRRAASRAIQRFGPQAVLFIPDIILMAEKKENARSVDRLLRRFERGRPDVRSLPELVRLLGHKQEKVRLLAIKFLGLAGGTASEAIPALERMRDDPSPEVRKQAQAACELIQKKGSVSSPTVRAGSA
jgi:HEAT repeat protein